MVLLRLINIFLLCILHACRIAYLYLPLFYNSLLIFFFLKNLLSSIFLTSTILIFKRVLFIFQNKRFLIFNCDFTKLISLILPLIEKLLTFKLILPISTILFFILSYILIFLICNRLFLMILLLPWKLFSLICYR